MKKAKILPRSILLALSLLGLAVTISLALLVFAPFLQWQLRPFNELNLWVIDKTVPFPDYRKHTSLFWILKNEKISKPGGRQLYSEKSDYFGFYPYGKNDWRGIPLPQGGLRPDLIYIADTYGVYEDDFMQKKLYGELSPKIYGGLTSEEVQTIRKNLGAGNTFIAEFNTAASPTNIKDRQILGRVLGLEWKGWIGRFFSDLSKDGEVPPWVIKNYEALNKKEWNFFGRGFVLISDNDQLEVLTEMNDVGIKGLRFSFREPWGSVLKSRENLPFRSWFEWTVPDPEIEITADYSFDLTEAGAAKLSALGLEPSFPAILRNRNTQFTGWYFAGDFLDLKASGLPHGIAGLSWLKKLLSDDSLDSNENFYWKAYVPLMRSILKDASIAKIAREAIPSEKGETRVKVRAFGSGFQMRDKDGIWKDFFVRGVNMGFAEPGKYFTEFPQNINSYLRWLDAIAEMGANTVRIYTLPPPEFYKALQVHNTGKPDKPLYLLQELWPEEYPPHGDYLAKEYREGFLKEIDYGIDAVYGRANVPERRGRAWGIYTTDVSKWLLGWLVGRELESEEVMETDARNKGASYTGRFVSAGKEATPTEVWLAESLDEVASIESARYSQLHPVALVSWPTLDPKEHDSEWDPVTEKKNKGNDRAVVTIDHFEITPSMTAGLFGAYHIYPNYPDFINNEVAYGAYKDKDGLLRYGGYLKEFMESHRRFPALVAEFGIANGAGIAHFAPDGLHHGGLDEKAAGEGILRMLAAIKKEGYAGGVVFEWMDEWVKKTWTTETLMIPYDRHVLWHNVVDPEQNYGLMANEALPPESPGVVVQGSGAIDSMELSADASYLHILLRLSGTPDFSSQEILVGLDTLDRDKGQMFWPVGGLATDAGLEFLVRIEAADKADLLVIPSYNAAMSRFATVEARDGKFERISLLVNGKVQTKDGRVIAEKRFDASALRKGAFDETGNLWHIEGNTIRLRLPWTLINVTDPSSLRVLQETRTGYLGVERDNLTTMQTDGFIADVIVWNKKVGTLAGRTTMDRAVPFIWKGWETAPPYRERLKKSYYMLRDAWRKPEGAAVK
ncbi:MAG: hypothetical protein Q8O15_03570 [Rectinemataceae bacterium]|nr:hypothetical protein [Rectinemataceae bacterium]